MKNKKAGILIFIMWVLMILSLLSIAVSYNSMAGIRLAKYESEKIRSFCLARAGIAKMTIELNKDKNNYDSLNENWTAEKELRLGAGMVTCRAYDEDARFNLNGPNLNKEHLTRLGLDDDISQRLLDYRNGKGENGFEFIEELFLIDGMTLDIYSGLKEYVTIYRGLDPRVNINTAGKNVLEIVLGNEPLIISRIITYREGDDAKICTEDDGIFTENNFSAILESFGVTPGSISDYEALFKVRSEFFRILAGASLPGDKGQVKRITAVIDRPGKIYYWKEE